MSQQRHAPPRERLAQLRFIEESIESELHVLSPYAGSRHEPRGLQHQLEHITVRRMEIGLSRGMLQGPV